LVRLREIASWVLVLSAGQNDKAGRDSTEAVESLGESGLLGLMPPGDSGGSGPGPRTFAAVTATLAEADPSVAMVYLMDILGTTTLAVLKEEIVEFTAVLGIPKAVGVARRISSQEVFSEPPSVSDLCKWGSGVGGISWKRRDICPGTRVPRLAHIRSNNARRGSEALWFYTHMAASGAAW